MPAATAAAKKTSAATATKATAPAKKPAASTGTAASASTKKPASNGSTPPTVAAAAKRPPFPTRRLFLGQPVKMSFEVQSKDQKGKNKPPVTVPLTVYHVFDWTENAEDRTRSPQTVGRALWVPLKECLVAHSLNPESDLTPGGPDEVANNSFAVTHDAMQWDYTSSNDGTGPFAVGDFLSVFSAAYLLKDVWKSPSYTKNASASVAATFLNIWNLSKIDVPHPLNTALQKAGRAEMDTSEKPADWSVHLVNAKSKPKAPKDGNGEEGDVDVKTSKKTKKKTPEKKSAAPNAKKQAGEKRKRPTAKTTAEEDDTAEANGEAVDGDAKVGDQEAEDDGAKPPTPKKPKKAKTDETVSDSKTKKKPAPKKKPTDASASSKSKALTTKADPKKKKTPSKPKAAVAAPDADDNPETTDPIEQPPEDPISGVGIADGVDQEELARQSRDGEFPEQADDAAADG